MKSHILPFFATANDLQNLLKKIGDSYAFRLVRGGLLDEPVKDKLLLSENLLPRCRYLLVEEKETVQVEVVPQRKGGIKYAIHQDLNPKSVGLFTGELIKDKILLPGQFDSIGDPSAETIFTAISKLTKKTFSKVKSVYLGSEALELFDSGLRLATSIKGDPIYDLRR